MRKPYTQVSGITKKIYWQLIEGVKSNIFVPVCYNSFNASRIYELKRLYTTILCNVSLKYNLIRHKITHFVSRITVYRGIFVGVSFHITKTRSWRAFLRTPEDVSGPKSYFMCKLFTKTGSMFYCFES